MNILTNIAEWHAIQTTLTGKSIGFVPTMGNLHAGHISLCQRANADNDITIVSIFVNPTQFNQASDLALYPRTEADDIKLLTAHNVDYVFLPEAAVMYQDDYQVQVMETAISQELEGQYRPGHFTGMLTVVLKLLNIIQPTRAYFGEKDYQQLLLIKKMVSALFLPIDIIACDTVRANDGLALSSRNSRLNAAQREMAVHFPRLLNSASTPTAITRELESLGFKVDYIADQWQRRLGAVWLDDIRLIDNIPLPA